MLYPSYIIKRYDKLYAKANDDDYNLNSDNLDIIIRTDNISKREDSDNDDSHQDDLSKDNLDKSDSSIKII